MDRVIEWLLNGDPAIRWQALRDLTGAAERTVRREQRRVSEEGWGARLLALQDPDGRWGSGATNVSWARWEIEASMADCSERGMLAGCKAAGPGCPEAYPMRYAEDKRGRERSSRTTGPLRTEGL